MQSVVADEVLRSRLGDLSKEIEVRDESGRLLGRYLPERPAMTREELMATCPFTEEDLERARREPGGKTLGEIWRELGRVP
jgi:hypothetical protein